MVVRELRPSFKELRICTNTGVSSSSKADVCIWQRVLMKA
jgi:hypothetical protein